MKNNNTIKEQQTKQNNILIISFDINDTNKNSTDINNNDRTVETLDIINNKIVNSNLVKIIIPITFSRLKNAAIITFIKQLKYAMSFSNTEEVSFSKIYILKLKIVGWDIVNTVLRLFKSLHKNELISIITNIDSTNDKNFEEEKQVRQFANVIQIDSLLCNKNNEDYFTCSLTKQVIFNTKENELKDFNIIDLDTINNINYKNIKEEELNKVINQIKFAFSNNQEFTSFLKLIFDQNSYSNDNSITKKYYSKTKILFWIVLTFILVLLSSKIMFKLIKWKKPKIKKRK